MVGGRRCPLLAGTRGRNMPAMQRTVIRTLWAEGAECRKAKRLSKFSKWRTESWLAGLESRAERKKENAPSELGEWTRVRPQWPKTVECVVLNHLIVWVQDILCLKAKLGTLPLMLTLSYLLKPGDILLLMTSNLCCFLHERSMNPRYEVLRQGIWLYLESLLMEKMVD